MRKRLGLRVAIWLATCAVAPAATQVVMLGTGTPNPDPDRSGPAVAIVVNDTPYLVDCGAGVVRRAAAAVDKGVKSLEAKNLKIVFITHLHSDHTLGLPDLILTPWTLGRTRPLEAFGPAGLAAMTRSILAAYKQDLDVRLNGGEPSNRTGYRVNAHEIHPGVVFKDTNVTVTAFLVKHGVWKQAFGYRFDTPDKSIVLSGDTVPAEAVVSSCQGCDILIHEVYSTAGFQKRPPEWQKYHAHFHTSSRELAELASKAKPKLLVLYHQLFWGTTEDDLLKEVRSGYKGRVISAHDLDVY